MPFTGQHREIPYDEFADSHNQLAGFLAAGEFLDNPMVRAMLTKWGWDGAPFTQDDAVYLSTHAVSGGGGSLMASLVASMFAARLIGHVAGDADPTPAPAPVPAPAVASAGAFADLEIEIGRWGLGESDQAAALAALTALIGAFNRAAAKVGTEISSGVPWVAAVNCSRLSDLFGVQSRYIQHAMQTYPLSRRDWQAALNRPFDDESGDAGGLHIAGE
jgi:hypothetical protein